MSDYRAKMTIYVTRAIGSVVSDSCHCAFSYSDCTRFGFDLGYEWGVWLTPTSSLVNQAHKEGIGGDASGGGASGRGGEGTEYK